MSKATFTLRLPPSLKGEAAGLAKLEGVSLNQWIVAAVMEKIAAAKSAESIPNAQR